MHPDEAREAINRGADGIIVSNHGGRQLDGAVASIRALPGMVEAVGGRAPVLIDGGFRRGIDVVKALALGARAVMIGRPHLWGVACSGEDGVVWVLELFWREIDRALALGGWDSLAKLDRSIFFRQRTRRPAIVERHCDRASDRGSAWDVSGASGVRTIKIRRREAYLPYDSAACRRLKARSTTLANAVL